MHIPTIFTESLVKSNGLEHSIKRLRSDSDATVVIIDVKLKNSGRTSVKLNWKVESVNVDICPGLSSISNIISAKSDEL